MLSEKERAILGDREAQEAITARGELLPCPFCGREPIIEDSLVFCGACGLGYEELDCGISLQAWNHRQPLLTPTQMAVLGIAREPRKFEEGDHGKENS